MNRDKIIQTLTSLGERQLDKENQACIYIEELLNSENIPFVEQVFETVVPIYKSCSLAVDGAELDVLPSGLVSGEIRNNHTILSSLISSQKNLYDTNINFNPSCACISRSNHYFAPAFSINRRDVQKVIDGKTILGRLNVERVTHTSKNILVGNLKNPTTIIFSHYDSIATGAVDNASGTALSLELLAQKPELRESVLFALCGNEELSYDEPMYWGHGYRCFEETYSFLLEEAKQILVLDSFGHTRPIVFSDEKIMSLAFPIKTASYLAKKIKIISGDIDELMQFYHAENDTQSKIADTYMEETKNLILSLL